jgi:hypothetical protein
MPRKNRVTPFGKIIITPERGTFFGNRGILHDEQGRIQKAWRVKRWLVCLLDFRGRHRTVMTPNRYTELFFLDEATALAAGHRPCAECRHAAFFAFCRAWPGACKRVTRPSAEEIDDRLHVERLMPDGAKRSFSASLDRLPDGVFVTLDIGLERAYLLWRDRLLAWSPAGYHDSRARPKNARAVVLTPKSTVEAIRNGYVPAVHESTRFRPGGGTG